jgi:biopolymer transport protein ExbB/TolQ
MSVSRSHRTLPEWPLLLLALALVAAVCIPLWQWTVANDPGHVPLTGERVARMLLGPEQIASYACFTWACFILLTRWLELRRQRRAFSLGLLPAEEGVRILPEDARVLQRRADQLSARGGPYLLSNMIRLALSKFAISRSPQDASETVRTQAEVDLGRMASSMATVHYLVWAIPALGFLGTVRGIGLALTVAPDINDQSLPQFLDTTTRCLAVAFDTTLVALVLSLVLMFFLHSLQRGEETLVLDTQQYCLEHLVNRLYDLKLAGTESPAPMEKAPSTRFEAEKVWPV